MSNTPIRKITNTPLQGGAHNDIQILTLANNAGADTFTLTYLDGEDDEETTAALNDDANAAAIEGALTDLAGIEVGNVEVTGTNPDFVIEFSGALGLQAIPLLVGVGTDMDADVTAGTTGYNNLAVGETNQIQSIVVAGGSGVDSFTLTIFDGEVDAETTASIVWNATAAVLKAALVALTNIAAADITCGGLGTSDDPFTIEFGGKFAGQDLAALVFTGTSCTGTVTLQATNAPAGEEVDISGSQFFFFAVQEAASDLSGTFSFEDSKDGVIWSELTLTKASDGTDATDYTTGDPADTFYGQSKSGPYFVRASYEGTPFTIEVPVVALVAFG